MFSFLIDLLLTAFSALKVVKWTLKLRFKKKILTYSVFLPLGSCGCPTKLRLQFGQTLYWFQNFTTTRTHDKKLLFPKEEDIKELYRGVPSVEWLSLPWLIPQRVSLVEWLSLPCFIARRELRKQSPQSNCFYLCFDYCEL